MTVFQMKQHLDKLVRDNKLDEFKTHVYTSGEWGLGILEDNCFIVQDDRGDRIIVVLA